MILECPPGETPEVTALVEEVMEAAYTLTVPLHVSVEAGESWGVLH